MRGTHATHFLSCQHATLLLAQALLSEYEKQHQSLKIPIKSKQAELPIVRERSISFQTVTKRQQSVFLCLSFCSDRPRPYGCF